VQKQSRPAGRSEFKGEVKRKVESILSAKIKRNNGAPRDDCGAGAALLMSQRGKKWQGETEVFLFLNVNSISLSIFDCK
jgi:hypothetical protein